MDDAIPERVGRRLNSILKQIKDIEQSDKKTSFDLAEIIWDEYKEIHQGLDEYFSDQFFPSYQPHKLQHSGDVLELAKTQIRKIADYHDFTLDMDKIHPSSPNTVITQNQIVSQTNVQTLSNLIENVNSLQIPTQSREQIINLINEFEEESKGKKEPKTLRRIFLRVAGLSIDGAGFLLKHANEIGVLKDLLA